jgi:molybdopterin-binding protein
MSSLIAKVAKIQRYNLLHIVEFDCYSKSLYMISLDLTESITIGREVKLTIKPSHIVIAKEFQGDISFPNRLECTILSIERGELLSNIKLRFFDYILETFIMFKSYKEMKLKVGDRVVAMFKATELSIEEVI